ncbi:hypothetical protein CRENBAI_020221 [Crenichthys baileyi]|uniref:Uncharacterized protein n=1 Tax=Crenichthys baileyi TaxID=28760 RepID=A0AAV9SAD5_9TELE
MRFAEKPLEPRVILKARGEVESAHCTLMAAVAEKCVHVAALLVHQILQRRNQFGENHCLLQELCLDNSRFERYSAGTVSPLENTCPSVFVETALTDSGRELTEKFILFNSASPASRVSLCSHFALYAPFASRLSFHYAPERAST